MAARTYAEFMAALWADYDSPCRPPLSVCYRRCWALAHLHGWALAHLHGWDLPSLSTARRLVAARGDAGQKSIPPLDLGDAMAASCSADDSWRAVDDIVECIRAANRQAGGSDQALGRIVALSVARIGLPVTDGGSQ